MMEKCKDCGTIDGIIQKETGLCISCDRKALKVQIKQLRGHINHIRKVHDYWEIKKRPVKSQLRTAICNASSFSRRKESEDES